MRTRVYGDVMDISDNLECGTFKPAVESVEFNEIRVISDPFEFNVQNFRVLLDQFEESIGIVRQNGYYQASSMMIHTLNHIRERGYASTVALLNVYHLCRRLSISSGRDADWTSAAGIATQMQSVHKARTALSHAIDSFQGPKDIERAYNELETAVQSAAQVNRNVSHFLTSTEVQQGTTTTTASGSPNPPPDAAAVSPSSSTSISDWQTRIEHEWFKPAFDHVVVLLDGIQKSRVIGKQFTTGPPEAANPIAESMLHVLLQLQDQINTSVAHVEALNDVETGGNSDQCLMELHNVKSGIDPNAVEEWNRLTSRVHDAALTEECKVHELQDILDRIESQVNVLMRFNGIFLTHFHAMYHTLQSHQDQLQRVLDGSGPVVTVAVECRSTLKRRIDDESTAEPEFICPITTLVMTDPVIAADGHSYERGAITEWLSRGSLLSPMTGVRLQSTHVVPNHTLRALILRKYYT